jgi:hypothetical protein|tara:strand:- start:212 stop:418 length:207 start_codon:yes stop_codon:yes gene_type:complete
MMKIITWINFAAFILGVAGLGSAFLFRSKIFDAVLDSVKKELPALVQGAMPEMPKMPQTTGPVNPFAK